MPEVFSPQVITREIDISTVAPSVSTSIAAIVGGAVRGPVNDPTFITTPDQFVETFGEPTPSSFLGYTAINFLRQGNQLWVNRIASLTGDDPAATANTDTRAKITSESFTSFNFSGTLELQFDLDETVVVNFQPSGTNDVAAIANSIDVVLANTDPRLGSARVSDTDTTKVVIETQSKNGPLSSIAVVSTDVAAFSGKSATGVRTVSTEEALTAATITSVAQGATIDSTVIFASVRGDTYSVSDLFNVSKQPQEAFGVLSVDSNATFTEGVYNTATATVEFGSDGTAFTADETLTIGGVAFTLDFDNGVAESATNIHISGLTKAQIAEKIADWVNKSQTNGYASGIPAVAVTASVQTGSNVVTLKQIDPVKTNHVTITATTNSGNWATLDNANPLDAASNTTIDTDQDAANAQGDFITITIPASTRAGVEDSVDYHFMAGDSPGFTASATNSVSAIANSLAQAIDERDAYFGADETDLGYVGALSGLTYALSSSSSGNKVTVTTNANITNGLVAEGNGITVDLTGLAGSSITADDLNGTSLSHGFNDRSGVENTEYSFGSITVDGVTKAISFDTIPVSVMPTKHEATIQQVADGINFIFGDVVASVDSGTALRITSPTTGNEGTVAVSESSNFDTTTPIAQTNNDLFEDDANWADSDAGSPAPATGKTVTGQGDNHLVFVVDDTPAQQFEVDVLFTQSATLSLQDAVNQINAAAAGVDDSLASVASTDGTTITLTSPTSGSLTEFGSSLIVTNLWQPTSGPVFNSSALAEGSGDKLDSITISATTPGSWANNTVSVQFSDEDPLFFAANTSRVDVLIEGSVVETFREVTVNPNADGTTGVGGEGIYIEEAINGVSQYIAVDFDDDLVDLDPDTFTSSIKIVANTSALGNNPPYKLSGGGNGIDGITDSDVIGVPVDISTGEPTGLQVFADPEKIFVNLLAAPGYTSQSVGNELVSISESRADTLALIDPPIGLTPEEMVDWHNGQGFGRTAALNTSYAATYGTWLTQFDSFNNLNVNVPPSAFLLAQFAFNDAVAEPWFATAGLTRGRVTSALDVLSNPSLGQRELMYGQGNRVNPIRNLTQEGVVVWGNRTLFRQESALKEITVRRLLNFAKVVIGLASRVILFEPNDPTTSKRLIEIINPVLYSIRTRRGLTDFKVVDATTDRDRNLNRLVIRIFLQPTRTVEVIDIPFIITAQGGSFAI